MTWLLKKLGIERGAKMIWLNLALVLILVILIYPTYLLGKYAIGIIISYMAKKEFFFKEKREGHIFVVMKNKVFHHPILALRGHAILATVEMVIDYNNEHPTTPKRLWGVVSEDNIPDQYKKRSWIEREYGVMWIGLPWIHTIYRYLFSWTSPREKMTTGKEIGFKEHQNELLDSILAQEKTYLFTIEEAENKDKAQFNLLVLLTWKCTNPFDALFGVQNWLETIISKLRAAGRNFVAPLSYESLLQMASSGSQADAFQKGLQPVLDEISKDYGITITNIDIAQIDPAGELSKQFVEASLKQYVAEQTAIETEKVASGQSKAIGIMAKANAEAIKVVAQAITDQGVNGQLVASLDALKVGAEKGKLVITALPFDIMGTVTRAVSGQKIIKP